jgi:hypothetical protein
MDIGKFLNGGLQTQLRMDLESRRGQSGGCSVRPARDRGGWLKATADLPAERDDPPQPPQPPRAQPRGHRRAESSRHRVTGLTPRRHTEAGCRTPTQPAPTLGGAPAPSREVTPCSRGRDEGAHGCTAHPCTGGPTPNDTRRPLSTPDPVPPASSPARAPSHCASGPWELLRSSGRSSLDRRPSRIHRNRLPPPRCRSSACRASLPTRRPATSPTPTRTSGRGSASPPWPSTRLIAAEPESSGAGAPDRQFPMRASGCQSPWRTQPAQACGAE